MNFLRIVVMIEYGLQAGLALVGAGMVIWAMADAARRPAGIFEAHTNQTNLVAHPRGCADLWARFRRAYHLLGWPDGAVRARSYRGRRSVLSWAETTIRAVGLTTR